MPVLTRQEVNIQRQVKATPQNFLVGGVRPRMEQPQTSTSNPIGSFLSGALDVWNKKAPELEGNARAQGVLDAQTEADPLSHVDEKAENIPFVLRGTYKEGYVTAAVQQNIAKFMAGTSVRAEEAALQGKSDEEFIASEREAASTQLSQLENWLPLINSKAKASVAQSLQASSSQALNQFQKIRSAKAKEASFRTLNEQGYVAQQAFFKSLDAGTSYGESIKYIDSHIEQVLANPTLSKKDKSGYMQKYYSLLGQTASDPILIENIANHAQSNVHDIETLNNIGKSLNTAASTAAKKQTLNVMFTMQDKAQQILQAPLEDRAPLLKAYKSNLINEYMKGTISAKQAYSMNEQLYKPAKVSANIQQGIANLLGTNNGFSPNGMAIQNGTSRKAVMKEFKDVLKDPNMAIQMMEPVIKGRDAEAIDTMIGAVGDYFGTLMNTLELTTDEQGNVPEDLKDSIQALYTIYHNGNFQTKNLIERAIPAEYRTSTINAFESNGQFNTDNLIDNYKQQSIRKQAAVNPTPLMEVKDEFGSKFAGWFDHAISSAWFNTDAWVTKVDSANDMLPRLYKHVQNTNPMLLLGDKSTVAKNLAAVATEFYTPVTVDKYKLMVGDALTGKNIISEAASHIPTANGSISIAPDMYAQAVGQVAEQGARATLGNNFSNITRIEISPQYGANSTDLMMNIRAKDESGKVLTVQGVILPKSVIDNQALVLNTAHNISEEAIATAEAGRNTVFYKDKASLRSISIKGENPMGFNPVSYNESVGDIIKYSGFSDVPKEGKIGFGQRAGNTKKVNPEMALANLQKELQEKTFPAVRETMNKHSFISEDMLMTLAQIKQLRPQDYNDWVEAVNYSINKVPVGQGREFSKLLFNVQALTKLKKETPTDVYEHLLFKMSGAIMDEQSARASIGDFKEITPNLANPEVSKYLLGNK